MQEGKRLPRHYVTLPWHVYFLVMFILGPQLHQARSSLFATRLSRLKLLVFNPERYFAPRFYLYSFLLASALCNLVLFGRYNSADCVSQSSGRGIYALWKQLSLQAAWITKWCVLLDITSLSHSNYIMDR